MPDFEALAGYANEGIQAKKGSKAHSWEAKKILFWRGATTGRDYFSYTIENWILFPRGRLVAMSRQYPDLIDAFFTKVVEAEERLEIVLRKMHCSSAPVSVFDSLAYKYLIDIDGNSCTYSRNYWILLSNSVLFKTANGEYPVVLRSFTTLDPLYSCSQRHVRCDGKNRLGHEARRSCARNSRKRLPLGGTRTLHRGQPRLFLSSPLRDCPPPKPQYVNI